MPLLRIWKHNMGKDDLTFVAQGEVIVDEEEIGHMLCSDEQLTILFSRIGEVLQGDTNEGEQDQD